MTATRTTRCSFDPALCPLLQGLSAEEQARRMREDPMIRACIAALDSPTGEMLACPGVRGPDAAPARAQPPPRAGARRQTESA
jgi:hypothetical protein